MPAYKISEGIFLQQDKIIRMGNPPVRIEILTGVSGVEFRECYARRERVNLEGVNVEMISLEDLKKNKKAAHRPKDLEDLTHLL